MHGGSPRPTARDCLSEPPRKSLGRRCKRRGRRSCPSAPSQSRALDVRPLHVLGAQGATPRALRGRDPRRLLGVLQRRPIAARAGGARARGPCAERRTLALGLVARWAKDAKVGLKMLNAWAETLLEKPAYRVRRVVD